MHFLSKALNNYFKEHNRAPVVGMAHSTFDLLHAGHTHYLEYSKNRCDFLIVGLLSDPTIDRLNTKNFPCQTMYERYLQLEGIRYVDFIIPFSHEEDIVNMLKLVKPDYRFLGEEYRDVEYTGKGLVEDVFVPRKHSFSSSKLRKQR